MLGSSAKVSSKVQIKCHVRPTQLAIMNLKNTCAISDLFVFGFFLNALCISTV